MERHDVERCAEQLASRRFADEPVISLGQLSLPDAYRIQGAVHSRLGVDSAGGPIAGYKIGCTTRVMQDFLGISHPCSGGIMANTISQGAGSTKPSIRGRFGIECEIAVTLARAPGDTRYDQTTIRQLVGSCSVAIEVVEDRYSDFSSIGTETLIADDFFAAGCVLGKRVDDWRSLDLTRLRAKLAVNGAVRGEGCGGDVMGHPLNALVWLVEHCAEHGFGLKEGHIILLGSLVQTQWLEPGDEASIEIESLGQAEFQVSADLRSDE